MTGRTDARRNRARLVEAARELFAEVGADAAAMNDVARRAGVGPGTLWRHFPNKEALLAEVVGQSLDGLAELAAELLRTEPEGFLRRWVDALVAHITRNRGLAASFMRAAEHGEGPLGTRCHAVELAAAELLARAQELGEARADLTAAELIRLATAVAWTSEATEGDPVRMLDVLFEGIL
ncbi:TetR/AcrR family transcriptional regulator [Allokutzneria multivorans]|uniref:TetR/AcrR family transcriptional regulator n=1 Tax=Allokutzneria multivorans TaxID=1142134 RepID=A0ABP7RWZ3_9PSEU